MDLLLEATRRAEREHFWFKGFRAFVAPLVARAAAAHPPRRLLDCGCGTGVNLPMLAQYGTAYGFDLTWTGLKFAKDHGTHRLAQASVVHVPFRDDAFDVVTCFDVLQCLPPRHRAAGARRVPPDPRAGRAPGDERRGAGVAARRPRGAGRGSASLRTRRTARDDRGRRLPRRAADVHQRIAVPDHVRHRDGGSAAAASRQPRTRTARSASRRPPVNHTLTGLLKCEAVAPAPPRHADRQLAARARPEALDARPWALGLAALGLRLETVARAP